MNPKIDEEIIKQSRYKIGRFGLVFRFSPERGEWLKSELTVKEFKEARKNRIANKRKPARKKAVTNLIR